MQESDQWLNEFVSAYSRLFVLTGAGVSTDSGIPGYRDSEGQWKSSMPIQGPEFKRSQLVQKRYWARSLVGWSHFGKAEPNSAHFALAELESIGVIRHLLTQNVDGLHQRSGSRDVTDLHGKLDTVVCLECAHRISRRTLQTQLEALNPVFASLKAEQTPDGDARLNNVDFNNFVLVNCERCGGTLKPDVVFFGENVPKSRVEAAMEKLNQADAMLIAGSSLMVYSGYRFCLKAREFGIPIYAINKGQTRADHLFRYKANRNTGDTLKALLTLYKQQ